MRPVPSARPQAAVQAARAPTPSPQRSRIGELRIQNEVNPTPYRRAPKCSLPIISHFIGRRRAVQDKTLQWDVGWVERSETHQLATRQVLMGFASLYPSYILRSQNTSIVGK